MCVCVCVCVCLCVCDVCLHMFWLLATVSPNAGKNYASFDFESVSSRSGMLLPFLFPLLTFLLVFCFLSLLN